MRGLADRAEHVPELPAVSLAAGSVSSFDFAGVDALAVFAAPPAPDESDVQPRAGAVEAGIRYGVDLGEILARYDFAAKAGKSVVLNLPRPGGGATALPWDDLPPRLIVLGTGANTTADYRAAGKCLADAARKLTRVVAVVNMPADEVQAFAEGYLLGAYPTAWAKQDCTTNAELVIVGGDDVALAAGRQAAAATWLARHLAATPSNVKSPKWLARRAAAAASDAGLEVRVWKASELRKHGFGAIVAVGAGASHGPRLVEISYPGTGGRHVVIVGKGVTYDTGGLAIKPREAMVPMKTDMSGAGVALATVLAAAEASSPHAVTALLPIAENAVSGSAYRPGDALEIVDGTTVEVLNTDAEGRLLLADAMAYARSDLDPDVLVDIATLTGAATLGLSRHYGAYFTPEDDLAAAVDRASDASGERVWRMPLVDEYRSALDSTVADVANIATDAHVSGGAITAALFLQRFAGAVPWIHLDVAGPSREQKPGGGSGDATGFGARLLLRLLAELD